MKTKIATITFIAMLYVLPINAQESYLPVFGEGTTRFSYAKEGSDCDVALGYFEFSKDTESENTYVSNFYSLAFEVSNDNSKLWRPYTYLGEPYKDLLMDLNLNVGEQFKGLTVANVYHKDGRKHIEFEEHLGEGFPICTEDNIIYAYEVPFTFIEGIGPNTFDYYNSYGEWIYAQYKNGEFEYGIENARAPVCKYHSQPPYGSWWYDCPNTKIKEVKVKTLSLIPNPSNDKVQIILPDNIYRETSLVISDLLGRVIETFAVKSNSFVLDIYHYAPAIYVAKIDINNNQYVGKIIKN